MSPLKENVLLKVWVGLWKEPHGKELGMMSGPQPETWWAPWSHSNWILVSLDVTPSSRGNHSWWNLSREPSWAPSELLTSVEAYRMTSSRERIPSLWNPEQGTQLGSTWTLDPHNCAEYIDVVLSCCICVCYIARENKYPASDLRLCLILWAHEKLGG